jgi:hypothetical protein
VRVTQHRALGRLRRLLLGESAARVLADPTTADPAADDPTPDELRAAESGATPIDTRDGDADLAAVATILGTRSGA